MFKKFLVLSLAVITVFSLVACGEDATQTPTQSPTEAPVATATPVPLIKMTDDLLGESDLTYKNLIKTIKPYYEENVQKGDFSEPFDIDNGITASYFYLLKENSAIDCNVLGYKYEDNADKSYLLATYKEYEGKPNSIKLNSIVLNYEFTCESKEYAFKLIDRDVKMLCAFAEVETAEKTSASITQETCDSLITNNEALTVTVDKKVSAEFRVTNQNDTIVYNVKVDIK